MKKKFEILNINNSIEDNKIYAISTEYSYWGSVRKQDMCIFLGSKIKNIVNNMLFHTTFSLASIDCETGKMGRFTTYCSRHNGWYVTRSYDEEFDTYTCTKPFDSHGFRETNPITIFYPNIGYKVKHLIDWFETTDKIGLKSRDYYIGSFFNNIAGDYMFNRRCDYSENDLKEQINTWFEQFDYCEKVLKEHNINAMESFYAMKNRIINMYHLA